MAIKAIIANHCQTLPIIANHCQALPIIANQMPIKAIWAIKISAFPPLI
jgi:hypothetical protein